MLSEAAHAREDGILAPDEKLVLRLLEEAGNLSPWEVAARSPLGMRKTLAILGYLVRKELVVKTCDDFERVRITEEGLATITN
jgi:hypothetical protein